MTDFKYLFGKCSVCNGSGRVLLLFDSTSLTGIRSIPTHMLDFSEFARTCINCNGSGQTHKKKTEKPYTLPPGFKFNPGDFKCSLCNNTGAVLRFAEHDEKGAFKVPYGKGHFRWKVFEECSCQKFFKK